MTVRIYERVSTGRQRLDSQHGDLAAYASAREAEGQQVVYYTDKFTGRTTDRPGLKRLLAEVQSGDTVVVWRLDRLGRTAVGLHQLFERWITQRIGFVSIRDAVDLSTPAGRLVAGVLASVAAWETEVRAERVAAGLEAKRQRVKQGKDRWNVGRPKGTGRISPAMLARIKERIAVVGMSAAAREFNVSRQSIYKALEREQQGS